MSSKSERAIRARELAKGSRPKAVKVRITVRHSTLMNDRPVPELDTTTVLVAEPTPPEKRPKLIAPEPPDEPEPEAEPEPE